MLVRNIFENKNIDENIKEALVWGLVGGLAWGLAWGLVAGLAWGLVAGQYGLPIEITVTLGIIAFIAMEVMYYFANRKKPRDHVSLWYVLGRKFEELGEVLVVIINALNAWYLATKVGIDWNAVYEGIKTFGGYLIFIIGAIGLFILWLWLNKQVIPVKEQRRKHGK